MKQKAVKFSKTNKPEFIKELRSRVFAYFEENNISKHANGWMVLKSVCMVAMFLIPYFLLVTGVCDNIWTVFAAWMVMGLGVAGIGLSIMHDANHGAYSANKRVNTLMSYWINFVGGDALNWRIQHNVLHHSFTNIDGHDEDIDPGGLMRFSPHKERAKFHRFQHIYAWFLYGLMTLLWITFKDFKQLNRYKEKGLLRGEKKSYNRLLSEIIISKVLYYAFALGIPLLTVTAVAWWQTILFFIAMHYLAGLILALVFQPAHVIPEIEYPLPDENGKMDNNWAMHQLYTTANFAPGNKILSWYVGGLNYQVEHHLFPQICHIHYAKIAKIVKATAEEYGLPYHSQKHFRGAIYKHAQMLYKLGHYDMV